MKIKAIQLRKGNIINIDQDLFILTEVTHITPGNWRAILHTKMKNIRTGTNAEKRFSPDDKVEKAELETKKMEFLYRDGKEYHFMDKESFEQIALSEEFIGDNKYYLLPNSEVDVSFHNSEPLGIELPMSVELKVRETEPSLKTATVTTSYKPATLETGLKIQIPPFIQQGETIRVDTRDGKYLERVK
jgi:elongation factor P